MFPYKTVNLFYLFWKGSISLQFETFLFDQQCPIRIRPSSSDHIGGDQQLAIASVLADDGKCRWDIVKGIVHNKQYTLFFILT